MTKTILKVRLYGDPVLRKKSQLVKEVQGAERLLIGSMLETMYELPSQKDLKEVVITEECIDSQAEPVKVFRPFEEKKEAKLQSKVKEASK